MADGRSLKEAELRVRDLSLTFITVPNVFRPATKVASLTALLSPSHLIDFKERTRVEMTIKMNE